MDELKTLQALVREIGFQAKIVFEYLFGKKSELSKISVGFDNGLLPEDKVAGFVHPKDGSDMSHFIVKKEVLDDIDYLVEVVKHEMIHGAIGDSDDHEKSHGEMCNVMAEAMGLPLDLRD